MYVIPIYLNRLNERIANAKWKGTAVYKSTLKNVMVETKTLYSTLKWKK